ncbi:hypothetical protein OPV22_017061 [Ensete ventricosum]|uniref:SH3 domain-containing protein n=1 Tax=Ensete ventricosum TaxID=4639 RepID=A0AAV8QS80_ENSVE|nr:hypothetical protein OPV22_017061 [Ensete ventricosum]
MSRFFRHYHREEHGSNAPPPSYDYLGGRPPPPRTVRIYTKAEPNYSLSIRDGEVVLAPNDPLDDYQHWYKDMRYSNQVKDDEGFPSFALVNKVTGEAIKHSIGAKNPVRLIPYNPDYLDESILPRRSPRWNHCGAVGVAQRGQPDVEDRPPVNNVMERLLLSIYIYSTYYDVPYMEASSNKM